MVNRRLIELLGDSKRYIYGNVLCQWGMLLCSVLGICVTGLALSDLVTGREGRLLQVLTLAAAAVVVRHALAVRAADMSFMASRDVKKTLRGLIYDKLLRLGASYHEKVPTAEAVQLAAEGVEQLETYYSAFLPQFFYSMLAPVTLFLLMAFIHLPTALVLLIIVPLIPGAIVAVQKIAKRLLARYWEQYAKLGDSFLENLQGLTTLKIYQADERKAEQMAEESEHFRKITMKVLTMQLNSITVMDIIAYGGAAAGLVLSLGAFSRGAVSFWGCFVMIMLAAEFFLPLRALGSFFHTAMNGMAASEKMFRVLDMDETPRERVGMSFESLSFSYDGEREVLRNVSMSFAEGKLTAIVGESGSGKSTIASLLSGDGVIYIGHNSYIFKGTVAENLRLGRPDADDAELWSALQKVRLADFLHSERGLDTPLNENGGNLSGGQRQRLALARGLLHDSPVYIFDEATSNIDVESETEILAIIHELARMKTVVMITHRLANAVPADCVYVLEQGAVAGSGTHEQLLEDCPVYRALWDEQQELERYGRAAV